MDSCTKENKSPNLYIGGNIGALNGEISPLKLLSFTKIKFPHLNMCRYMQKKEKKTQKRKTSVCNNTNVMRKTQNTLATIDL